MKYRNKHFAKIGYKNSYTQSVFYDMANDKRKKQWKKQRKENGNYDERCIWDLGMFMAEQVYTWLSMYQEQAQGIIKTNDVPLRGSVRLMTITEVIDRVLLNLKFYLKKYDNNNEEDTEKALSKLKEAYQILGELSPYLWI